jgi:hypothetical protein
VADSLRDFEKRLQGSKDRQLGRIGRGAIAHMADTLSLYEYVKSRSTIYTDPQGEDWWNPFTWFPCWDEAFDLEIETVRELNETFGTNHNFLHQFTPEERATIEAALNTTIEWRGAFETSKKCLKEREIVLKGSKICVVTAGVADAAAACCVSIVVADKLLSAGVSGMTIQEQIALTATLLRAAREAGNGPLAAQLAAHLAYLEQQLPK